MIRWRAAGLPAAAAAVLLGGCSSVSCTAAACESVVSVDVTGRQGPTGLDAGPATLTLCVDTSCQDVSWPMNGPGPLFQQVRPAPTAARTVQVRLAARRSDGSALFDARASVPLVRVQPNGEGCEPVCWSAALRLSAGKLVGA